MKRLIIITLLITSPELLFITAFYLLAIIINIHHRNILYNSLYG